MADPSQPADEERLASDNPTGPDANHARLEFVGYVTVVAVLAVWVLGLWAGLFLAFSADPDAVRVSSTLQPGGALARAGYAAGALAGAGAAYVAGSGAWVLLNNSAAVLGLTVVTLVMTYLFQVVTATTQDRALSLWIHGLGNCPLCIAATGLGQSQLGAFGQQLTGMAQPLAMTSRYHLALPVVAYMHTPQRSAAIEVAVATLDEALTITTSSPGGASASAGWGGECSSVSGNRTPANRHREANPAGRSAVACCA